MNLWSGTFSMIRYSMIKILRLGKDYDTNSRFYGQHYKYDTRSDCFTSCVQNHHNTICNNTKLALMRTLVREKFISENRNKSFTNCSTFIQNHQDATISCSKHCKLNCQYKHYPADIQKISEIKNAQAQAYIEHNSMPDVMIKYIPETSLISFICNFGGLLGMWLGLSIMTIFKDILIPLFKLTWIKVKAHHQTQNVTQNIIHIVPQQNLVIIPHTDRAFLTSRF